MRFCHCSFSRATCIDPVTKAEVLQAFAADWPSMPVREFAWVAESRLSVTQTGRVRLPLGPLDQIPVQAGDILGIQWDSAHTGQLIQQVPSIMETSNCHVTESLLFY